MGVVTAAHRQWSPSNGCSSAAAAAATWMLAEKQSAGSHCVAETLP